jgi:DNA-binding NarL/FixJ family response regulator
MTVNNPQGKIPAPIVVSLVEDNQYVRTGWEAVLTNAPDFVVRGVFANCEEAFSSPETGESDLVLMDIGLPGMSGIDGVKYIKEHYPSVAVVMCTVHEDDQNIFDAVCAGAIGYLQKKIQPDELLKALRDASAGGSPMTPNIARKIIASFQRQPVNPSGTGEALTTREREVLEQMALGKSYATIAESLFLSVDGVRYHIRHIYDKLQVHTRGEAIAKGLKARLIHPQRQ